MMSGNYTSIDNQKVSGSVPAVSDSPHIAVKFADTFSKPRGGSKERNLDEKEKTVLALIRGAGDMGIWKGSLRREANFVVDNSLKTLLLKGLIKEVPDVQAKGKKRYMGVEFEPSTELTGGVWYQDGVFDADMIDNLRKARKVFLSKHKVMNAEAILNMVKKSGGFEFDIKIEHIKQVVETLCLENVVFKVKGNGLGEFASFPIGSECYKLRPKQKKVGAFASIPCGACPRITQCTPDGIISPATCVYYDTWLDF